MCICIINYKSTREIREVYSKYGKWTKNRKNGMLTIPEHRTSWKTFCHIKAKVSVDVGGLLASDPTVATWFWQAIFQSLTWVRFCKFRELGRLLPWKVVFRAQLGAQRRDPLLLEGTWATPRDEISGDGQHCERQGHKPRSAVEQTWAAHIGWKTPILFGIKVRNDM